MVSALLIACSFFLNRHARLRVKVKLLICVDQVVNYPERFLLTNCRHLKVSVLHYKQNVVVPPLEKKWGARQVEELSPSIIDDGGSTKVDFQ